MTIHGGKKSRIAFTARFRTVRDRFRPRKGHGTSRHGLIAPLRRARLNRGSENARKTPRKSKTSKIPTENAASAGSGKAERGYKARARIERQKIASSPPIRGIFAPKRAENGPFRPRRAPIAPRRRPSWPPSPPYAVPGLPRPSRSTPNPRQNPPPSLVNKHETMQFSPRNGSKSAHFGPVGPRSAPAATRHGL